MSTNKELTEFPNVEAKLHKPTRQSAFEKQRAEAEAKRQREAAETAAVYEDFVKSFDREDDDNVLAGGARGANAGTGFAPQRGRGGGAGFGGLPVPGASRRHFGSSGLKSGPGSLGGLPSVPFGKKRSFQDYSKGPRDKGTLGFDGHDGAAAASVTKAFDASDDEEMAESIDRAQEKAIARPTLRLSNLPPGTSPAVIKALIPEKVVVESVKIQPPAGPGGSERKCIVAIVTLSPETPANEMDAVVSLLQNGYMGFGYYLSIHRHLSSAVSTSNLPSLNSSVSGPQPFGAKPVEQSSGPSSNLARHSHHHAFAPPSSYGQGAGSVSRSDLLHVSVKPPQDIRCLQLINKVIEGVLEHGPEFEALLMSRPEVQREEKWAWLWDARSEGGTWYRWTLWGVVTGATYGMKKGKYVPLFEGSHAWKAPERRLPFEFTTHIDEFVSDSDYNSSDDEDIDGDGNHDGPGAEEKTFLNPLEKARLVQLLARLPTTLSKLRKGDIASVTAFAITHVSRGADEVADLIISNIEKPLSLTGANLDRKKEGKDSLPAAGTDEATSTEAQDASAASLVGLYVVSDILSSSSTSTVRHAWRYRQVFETALRERKVFENLGLMAEKLGWGRMRAEKWKRSVNLVLNLWEGWCAFPAESQVLFSASFENPPSLKAPPQQEEEEEEITGKGKWKTVESTQVDEVGTVLTNITDDSLKLKDSLEAEDDVIGEPIEEDDIEGEPIDEDDVEGEPIEEDEAIGEPMDEVDIERNEPQSEVGSDNIQEETGRYAGAGKDLEGRTPSRRRMRAVDMFADSEDSDVA